MVAGSTIKIFLLLTAIYLLLWLPYVVLQGNLPTFLNAPYAIFGLIQIMPVYLLNSLGVSGLLQNNGLCGWGWCTPSITGYLVLLLFWLAVNWVIASFISNSLKTDKTKT